MHRVTACSGQPLDVGEAYASAVRSSAGAVVLFVGTTRDHAEDKRVLRLSYEAFEPMALEMMEKMIDEAAARWPLESVVMLHRTGDVPVGEASVVIAVSSAHRSEAFEACRFFIDRLKQDVPIWKREYFADGTSEWTGASPSTPGIRNT
jgi:molybdopterin synthase catalytic subunit